MDVGCWDVLQVSLHNTTGVGVLLQIRAIREIENSTDNPNTFAISAAAPRDSGLRAVTIHMARLTLHGNGCSVSAVGGTEITVALNNTGATTVVHCQPNI